MLPFLAPKKAASIIMARRKASGGVIAEHEEGEPKPELMACAEDLISSVHAKDAKGVSEALEAAFHILDAMPHEEGEHLEHEEME